MKSLAAVLSGLVFGLGLAVSGMTDPAKVRAFLDASGAWDPSLALVMAGAIATHAALSRLVLRRRAPMLAPAFDLPPTRPVDARLLAGAAIFGVGWGIGGVCPGPALVSLASGRLEPVVFTLAMAFGVVAERFTLRRAATA